MPTISIYLDERTYWKVHSIAIKEDLTIPKTVQLIVKAYFEHLERKEVLERQKEGIGLSTKAT